MTAVDTSLRGVCECDLNTTKHCEIAISLYDLKFKMQLVHKKTHGYNALFMVLISHLKHSLDLADLKLVPGVL